MGNISNHYLPVGTILYGQENQYRIQKVLGEGTFGITYLAKAKVSIGGKLGHLNSEIDVAVKEFFMKDFNERQGTEISAGNNSTLFIEYRKKFKREALNLSFMKHQGIVNVIESFDANNTSYYVMEYLPGGSLDDEIKQKGRLSIERVQKLIPQICQPLSYMHQKKVLHLDLKPQNIMIDGNGKPILIDFGLSKVFDKNGNPESTTMIGGGTDGYAPIEQSTYNHSGKFAATLDIYAFGGTLYKMLTGKQPPSAPRVLNDKHILKNQLSEVGVPHALIRFIEKAMAALQNDRIQDVEEFLANFQKAMEGDSKEDTELTWIPENNQKLEKDVTNEEDEDTLKHMNEMSSSKLDETTTHSTQNNDEEEEKKKNLHHRLKRFSIIGITISSIIGLSVFYMIYNDKLFPSTEEVVTLDNDIQIIKDVNQFENIQFNLRAPTQVKVNESFVVSYTINTTNVKDFKVAEVPGITTVIGPLRTEYPDSVQYKINMTIQKEGNYKLPSATIMVNGKNESVEFKSNEANIKVLPQKTKEQLFHDELFNKAKTIKDFKELADRRYVKAYLPLAKLYMKSDNYDLANIYITKAIEAKVDLEEAWQMVEALEQLGYYEDKSNKKPKL